MNKFAQLKDNIKTITTKQTVSPNTLYGQPGIDWPTHDKKTGKPIEYKKHDSPFEPWRDMNFHIVGVLGAKPYNGIGKENEDVFPITFSQTSASNQTARFFKRIYEHMCAPEETPNLLIVAKHDMANGTYAMAAVEELKATFGDHLRMIDFDITPEQAQRMFVDWQVTLYADIQTAADESRTFAREYTSSVFRDFDRQLAAEVDEIWTIQHPRFDATTDFMKVAKKLKTPVVNFYRFMPGVSNDIAEQDNLRPRASFHPARSTPEVDALATREIARPEENRFQDTPYDGPAPDEGVNYDDAAAKFIADAEREMPITVNDGLKVTLTSKKTKAGQQKSKN